MTVYGALSTIAAAVAVLIVGLVVLSAALVAADWLAHRHHTRR